MNSNDVFLLTEDKRSLHLLFCVMEYVHRDHLPEQIQYLGWFPRCAFCLLSTDS